MASITQKIPDILIYEMVNGHPVYYRGYLEYLNENKTIDEIMGSSKLQAFLAAELIFLLKTFLGKDYLVFANELGLLFSKKSWRAADIAVIKKSQIDEINEKYLSIPPEYVIEIDTKADFGDIKNPLGYYQEKTEELLNFGVRRVIWIFTDTGKVLIADKGKKKWEIIGWEEDIEIIEGLTVNIHQLLPVTE